MRFYKKTLAILLLSSTCLVSFDVLGADQTINLNNTNYTGPISATEMVAGNNFDNVVINVNNSTFNDRLVGNRKKTMVNQTLNFNSGTTGTYVAGTARTDVPGQPRGIVSGINTVNINGGTIAGYVAATVDEGTASYTGTERRSKNIINFNGGNIQGHIIGGAGAEDNIITVTGGVLGKTTNGVFTASNIMAAAGGLPNKSTNTWVHLKDMTNSNSFLSSFVEVGNSVGGTILGGAIPGVSNMNFDNVNGTFLGGFKNFHNMFLDSASNVILGGTSYFANNWNISGTLDTNGKTAHAYTNDTLQLTINSMGNTKNTFISDANVNANNAGLMNGIRTTKNITVNNTGTMSGNYTGSAVNITNAGKINDATHTNTTITSTNAGTLINNGQIGGDAGSVVTVNGNMSVTNAAAGTINGQVILNDTVSSFINRGIMGANTGGTGIFQLTNNSNLTHLENYGVVGGTGSVSSTALLTLNNNSGGLITGTQTLKNVNLDNKSGAFVQDASITSDTNPIAITNSGTFSGSNAFSSVNGGTYTLENQTQGLVTGNLTINNGLSGPIHNNGLMNNLNITNHQNNVALENAGTISGMGSITSDSLLTLNNNSGGLITGTQTLKNVNLDNKSGAFVQNANLISDTTLTAIANEGTFEGSNTLAGINGGTFTFDNKASGLITGALDVQSGLDTINNEGTINNLALQSERDNLTIDNSGSFTGDNSFTSDKKITLDNTGISSGTVTVNAAEVDVIQHSTTELTNDFYGNLASSILSFDNKAGSTINSGLFNQFATLNITNEDTGLTAPEVNLTNNGTISSAVTLKNKGYTKLTNAGSITGMISDAYFDVIQPCLQTIFEIDNTNTIASNISVLNNKFILNNSGLITSTNIDSNHLTLTNSGTFESNGDYLFGVHDYINANNTGTIHSKDFAIQFTGDKTSGTITNSGTIWSEGTTIGFADTLTPCPNGCGYTGSIDLYNTGNIVSVDPTNLTKPNLNSHAINADNMNVFNQSGGLIGGSILAKNYTQNDGATWVTFLNKDTNEMSTITVKDRVTIDDGATLFIYTNNDVKQFKDDDTILVVKTDTGSSMTDQEIYAQLDNFTLKTDSPFANYHVLGNQGNGYIVFNSVAANTYAAAADIATANHTNIGLGSHRFYELFVNKNIDQVQNLSPAGKPDDGNGLYFMPMGGQAGQDSNGGHSGYRNTYYGGVGYFEHDFDHNIKGGLGMAYLYNDNKYKDAYNSRGNFDTYRPFVYVDYEPGDFRADLAVGYARHNIHDSRKYKFNDNMYNAKGDYNADEFSGHLNLGYKVWNQNGEVIQPMVGVYATHLNVDSYNEKGQGPMNMHVDSDSYNSVKSMLGLKMSKEYKPQKDFTYIPELHLRWYHEMADTQGGVNAYFLAQEQWFDANGVKAPKDIGDVAVRLTTKSVQKLDLFTELYYQFGQSFYNLGGAVGAKYNF